MYAYQAICCRRQIEHQSALEKCTTHTTIYFGGDTGDDNLSAPVVQEQRAIIDAVERLSASYSQLDRRHGRQILIIELLKPDCDVLRRSILKKAFAGQLVAQNPNDEPASVLLDRIKVEKEQASKKSRDH